jgi:hypothetical protein
VQATPDWFEIDVPRIPPKLRCRLLGLTQVIQSAGDFAPNSWRIGAVARLPLAAQNRRLPGNALFDARESPCRVLPGKNFTGLLYGSITSNRSSVLQIISFADYQF